MNQTSISDLWALLKREYRLKTVLAVGLVWLLWHGFVVFASGPWLFGRLSWEWQLFLWGWPLISWGLALGLSARYSWRLAQRLGACFWVFGLGYLAWHHQLAWGLIGGLVFLGALGSWILESTIITLCLQDRLNWPWIPLDAPALIAAHEMAKQRAQKEALAALRAEKQRQAEAPAAVESRALAPEDLKNLGLTGRENYKAVKVRYQARLTELNQARRQRHIKVAAFQKQRRELERSFHQIRFVFQQYQQAKKAQQAEAGLDLFKQKQARQQRLRRQLRASHVNLLQARRDYWRRAFAHIEPAIGDFGAYFNHLNMDILFRMLFLPRSTWALIRQYQSGADFRAARPRDPDDDEGILLHIIGFYLGCLIIILGVMLLLHGLVSLMGLEAYREWLFIFFRLFGQYLLFLLPCLIVLLCILAYPGPPCLIPQRQQILTLQKTRLALQTEARELRQSLRELRLQLGIPPETREVRQHWYLLLLLLGLVWAGSIWMGFR